MTKIQRISMAVLIMLFSGLKETTAGPDQEIMRQLQLARAFEETGEWIRAREIYERIYRQDPENTAALDPYFECCLKLQSFNEALSVVDRRLSSHAGDVHAACLRGRALARAGLKAQALKEWNRLCGLRPKDESVYRDVAGAMIREQLFEEAVGIYERGRRETGSSESFALELSILYELSGNFGDAALELMVYYRSRPDRLEEVKNRLERFPKTESASGGIFNQMKRMPEILAGNEWLFRFFLRAAFSSGNDGPVFEFTDDMEGRDGSDMKGILLFRLAEEAVQSGHFPAAEKAYRVIRKKYPDFPKGAEMDLGLARCFQSQKRYNEAVLQYNEIIRKNPDQAMVLQAFQEKGRISMLFLEDFNEAKNAFQNLITKFPDSAERSRWRLDFGRCEMMLGNFAAAESLFQDVMQFEKGKEGGNWIQPAVLLAQTRVYGNHFDEAVKALDQLSIREVNGQGFRDPWLNDGLELKIFLREYYGRCPECVRMYAGAEFRQKQKRPAEALTVLDSIPNSSAGSGMGAEILFKKAEIMLQLGRYGESLGLIRQFQNQYPGHPKMLQALMLSAGADEKTGNRKGALDLYDKVLREYPHTLSAEESKERIRALQAGMKP